MATAKFKAGEILIKAETTLNRYNKLKEKRQLNIATYYINQHNFLNKFIWWLKPLTFEDIKRDSGRYLSLSELFEWDLCYVNQLCFLKDMVEFCNKLDAETIITLTEEEYLRLD